MQIERIQVYCVKPNTPRYAWSPSMPDLHMTNTFVRIVTTCGQEGAGAVYSFSEYGADYGVAEAMRPLLPGLIGQNALNREAVWQWLLQRQLTANLVSIAPIDIALWDLAAKAAGMPLYQFLGGFRSRIPAYASTHILSGPDAYIDLLHDLRQQGFKAIKFHYVNDPTLDIDLALKLSKEHSTDDVALMFDADQRYTRQGAMRVANVLEDLGYTWLEAPLPDYDIEGYRALRDKTNIDILPGGNTITHLQNIEHSFKQGCWDSLRLDAITAGGITPARKAMAFAEAKHMNLELQSWGCALSQAPNLHLMLAFGNCSYFEQPIPYDGFEHGTHDVIRVDRDGYVSAPDRPGLGIRVDWDLIEDSAFHKIDIHTATSPEVIPGTNIFRPNGGFNVAQHPMAAPDRPETAIEDVA